MPRRRCWVLFALATCTGCASAPGGDGAPLDAAPGNAGSSGDSNPGNEHDAGGEVQPGEGSGGRMPGKHDAATSGGTGGACAQLDLVNGGECPPSGGQEAGSGVDFGPFIFELFQPDGYAMFGSLAAENDASGVHADYGELHVGSGYAIALTLQAADFTFSCSTGGAGGLGADTAISFSIEAGMTTAVRASLPCTNGTTVQVRVDLHGATRACVPFAATPPELTVRDSAALSWDTSGTGAEYEFAVTPSQTVGSLHLESTPPRFECQASGIATLTLHTSKGPCGGLPQAVNVTCKAREGETCCPIDPLDPVGCMAFGGSPPCYTGCQCLRNGGQAATRVDANGCLERSLTVLLGGPQHVLCLDSQGAPHPDPRLPPGSYDPAALQSPAPNRR